MDSIQFMKLSRTEQANYVNSILFRNQRNQMNNYVDEVNGIITGERSQDKNIGEVSKLLNDSTRLINDIARSIVLSKDSLSLDGVRYTLSSQQAALTFNTNVGIIKFAHSEIENIYPVLREYLYYLNVDNIKELEKSVKLVNTMRNEYNKLVKPNGGYNLVGKHSVISLEKLTESSKYIDTAVDSINDKYGQIIQQGKTNGRVM